LGLKEFQYHVGDNYFEILPVSFEADIPYHYECCIHFSVGASNDQYVCTQRYNGKPCYRCEQQGKMYKEIPKGTKPSDEIKALYPADRIFYLLWDRTDEIAENKEPEYQLYIWDCGKKKVHSEIQILVRDKKAKTTLDISDIEDDGEGRTVNFEVHQKNKGDFPDYKGFALIERDESIPDEVLEMLNDVITTLEEEMEIHGYKHPLEALLHIPEYKEIKESMKSESSDDEEEEEKEEKPKGKKEKKNKKDKPDEDELVEKLEELQEELEEMNNFKFKKWCKNNDYEDALDIDDREEAVKAIIDDLYSKVLDGDLGMEEIG
jgi:hypothetical protein